MRVAQLGYPSGQFPVRLSRIEGLLSRCAVAEVGLPNWLDKDEN